MMETIKDTVVDVLKQLRQRSRQSSENGPQSWMQRVFSKSELRHIRFGYFRKGVLGLKVDSSSRLYQLTLRKQQLLAGFAEHTDEVKDLRFRIGEGA